MQVASETVGNIGGNKACGYFASVEAEASANKT